MSYEVLGLCEDKGEYFEVDPAVMFPATIGRIREVLAGALPTEIVSKGWTGHPLRDPVVDRFLRRAETFPVEAWDLALEPYQEPAELEPASNAILRRMRADALALAEDWFKRALALAVGRGLRVHIGKNADYRR